ncbi:hypothetical protein GDO78_005217 [Eleutherodactylus coqui]|uniref:Uncharacterized protein n=1 Tax=Eleutherodactylus coqui TaxID=57060 RepID=A0A8J6FM07_ELECQ|nr:hypothetical protein GDO78_005217 [Eleutherodactylus coqui]
MLSIVDLVTKVHFLLKAPGRGHQHETMSSSCLEFEPLFNSGAKSGVRMEWRARSLPWDQILPGLWFGNAGLKMDSSTLLCEKQQ